MALRQLEWEIKVTKLCNLRCAYCYEFSELGDARRVPLHGWRTILEGARWYQAETCRRHPRDTVTTRFVWHGGEPALLPASYYREVLALQREILGAASINTVYFNHAPTNAYAIPPEIFTLWERERFVIAVSYDGIAGVRVTPTGRPTEARVRANIRRFLASGRRMGCNTVVTAWNVDRLLELYDEIRELSLSAGGRLYWNLIPLHSTPTDDGSTAFSLGAREIVDALLRLFERWLDDPEAISVTPLRQYYLAVVRKLLGLSRFYFDRRTYGESSLTVNTDGYVYVFGETYDRNRTLGCLFERSFEDIVRSEAYRASLDRQDALAERLCRGCPYDGYCNREPLVNGHREETGERSAIAYPLHRGIEVVLASRGFTEATLRGRRRLELPNARLLRRAAV